MKIVTRTSFAAIAGYRVTCPYCQQPANLVDSIAVYKRSYGKIYHCAPCKAWVGVHPGTIRPLGRLANAELRAARQRAHAAFDPLWRGRTEKRSHAYRALAEALGMTKDQCHIGMFDVADCERVVFACANGLVEVPR